MVFSRGLVISLGVSALSATLLFLYFRNRMASVERKVDVMFDLIQSHETDRQQMTQQMMMRQQNQVPTQNTREWESEENLSERNLIDVSEDDGSDEEYDSEDSREVSDNEEDLEERIKLVTNDINDKDAEEMKSVVVLETDTNEPVTINESVKLEEVTDNLEEDSGSSGDVENTTQSADKADDDVDSLDEEDSQVEEDEDEDEEEEEEEDSGEEDIQVSVEYNKLKVTELKAIAEAKGLTNYKSLKKQPLIDLIKASE